MSENDSLLSGGGYMRNCSEQSPLFQYFDNDHLQFPFNWENLKKHGAPFCTWSIQNDSLFLEGLELRSGTCHHSIKKQKIKFDEVIKERGNSKIWANWVSSYFVVYANRSDSYLFMKIENGVIIDKVNVEKGFDFYYPPKDTEPEVLNMINQFNGWYGW